VPPTCRLRFKEERKKLHPVRIISKRSEGGSNKHLEGGGRPEQNNKIASVALRGENGTNSWNVEKAGCVVNRGGGSNIPLTWQRKRGLSPMAEIRKDTFNSIQREQMSFAISGEKRKNRCNSKEEGQFPLVIIVSC